MPRFELRLPNVLRRSFVRQFVAAVGIVAIVLGAVGAGLYVQTGSMLERETERELASAAKIEADTLDEWFEQTRLQTRSIAEASPLQATDRSAVTVYLWDVVDRNDDLEAAYLVDTANGTVVTSVGSARIISSTGVTRAAGQREFTRRAHRSDEVVVSRPFRPYEGSAPVILLSAAVPGRESRSLVTVVNLNRLSSSQAHQLDQARFQVVDDDGTVVMAENESRILGPSSVTPRPPDGSGFTRTDHEGHAAAVGYASMDERNWTVTARMPAEQAFALRSAVLEGVIWMLAAVVIGLGTITLTLARGTVRPIRGLAATARQLQDGTLDEPVETDRIDELGDLYEAFDTMRASLRQQIQRTERARRESERLTEELEREAERFGAVMAACADGELDRRLDTTTDSEQLRAIAESFNEMMDDVQQQNEELEAFTSIISHDLRNPLTVAKGRAKLLGAEDDVDDEHLEPLVRSLERMQAIVDDGLTLARGTRVEEPVAVDLADRARRAWEGVETPAATLSVDVPDGTRLRADPDLLAQVFENLFRNAVEHAGPEVTVRVGVSVHGFVVEDDGPGLPDERTESVFDPGVSDGSGGTGLGLTIVSRIAEAHGWDVRATSAGDDGGARFEFVVDPSTGADPESSADPAAASTPVGRSRSGSGSDSDSDSDSGSMPEGESKPGHDSNPDAESDGSTPLAVEEGADTG